MAHLKEDKIDFGKLEKELLSAVEADARYWRENDAKLRAVDQRVETYDQFRDMVAAAHIKPLDKKDKFGQNKRSQPWNPYSTSKDSSLSSAPARMLGSPEVLCLPKNGHDFTKEWRKHKNSPDGRYAYLLEVGGDVLAKIFKSEIGFGLLGEIVTVLDERVTAVDAGNAVDILSSLSQTGRFRLSLDFLSKAERQSLTTLLGKLEEWEVASHTSWIDMDNENGEDVRLGAEAKMDRDVDVEIEVNRKKSITNSRKSQSKIERLKQLYELEGKR